MTNLSRAVKAARNWIEKKSAVWALSRASRGALGTLAWDLASAGMTDILALSGDYPADGYGGLSRPVFDVDSVALLAMLESMRRVRAPMLPMVPHTPPSFHIISIEP